MYIIRKRLFEREGAPPNTRYNEETDTVETSVDGGVTWTPNVGADPRVNPAYLLPPNTEPDVKCAAASGMVDYVQDCVNAAIDGTTIAGVGNALLAAVLVFLPITWFFALIAIVAEGLIAIGGAALSFNFTEDIYDQLLCIFYNHVDADGRLDETTLEAVTTDVDAIGNTVVSATFALIVSMVGHVGFSNAGVKHADSEAECDVCAPAGTCFEISFVGGQPTTIDHIFFGAFDTDHYGEVCTGGVGDDSNFNVGMTIGDTEGCTWQRVEIDITPIGEATDWYIYGLNEHDPASSDLTLIASGTASPGFQTVGGDVADLPYFGVRVICDNPTGCGTGDVNWYAVRICSDNLAHAGLESNCEDCPE